MGIRTKTITITTPYLKNFCQTSLESNKRDTSIMKLIVVLLFVGIVTVSCIPQRGGRKGGKRGPCKDNGGIEICNCEDGSTCTDRDSCKANCNKRTNPITDCTCADGEEWTKPEKPLRGPCKDNGGVESCECNDGSTCEDKDDCKQNCGKRNIVSCTCADGEEWTKPEKPSRPGKQRPCGSRREVVNCTCEDGETYERLRDIKRNCKR